MLIIRPIPPFLRRSRVKRVPPLPTALTLVSAAYVEGLTLTLSFDQAIDVGAFDGQAVFVDDGEFSRSVWIATGAVTLLDANTMRVGLAEFEASGVGGVTLTAPATTGIVAAGGGTWAGVSGVALPFG